MKKLVILLGCVTLSGCGILGDIAEKVADGVDKYCDEPFTTRAALRDQIDAATAADGHSIRVTCAGDPVE